MKSTWFLVLFTSLLIVPRAHAQCTKDTDCKGDRICVDGACVESPPMCGDGVCEGGGENCFSCPVDCRCTGKSCSKSCCGDGVCERENSRSCPADCGG